MIVVVGAVGVVVVDVVVSADVCGGGGCVGVAGVTYF